MVSGVFKQAVTETTGMLWETWVKELQQHLDSSWSHEQMKLYIAEHYPVSEEWSEWLTLFYGQLLGRVPVGVTKDAGVQIGVRKTLDTSKEQIWSFLTSDEGSHMLLGEGARLEWKVGKAFESREGITGKLTVVVPPQKLRMTWKLPEWEQPSRLQIQLLSTNSGKTTVAIHQEMLEDVYIRALMKTFWEERIHKLQNELASQQ